MCATAMALPSCRSASPAEASAPSAIDARATRYLSSGSKRSGWRCRAPLKLDLLPMPGRRESLWLAHTRQHKDRKESKGPKQGSLLSPSNRDLLQAKGHFLQPLSGSCKDSIGNACRSQRHRCFTNSSGRRGRWEQCTSPVRARLVSGEADTCRSCVAVFDRLSP